LSILGAVRTVIVMSIDLGKAYGAARQRICALVSDDVAGVAVPATPEWNVHDVVAHVVGVAEDAATGNMAGAPGDEWTAAQVERGTSKTLTEMLAQWDLHGPIVESFLSSPAGESAAAALFDIHTHEADLRNALGLPAEMPAEMITWLGAAMRDGLAAAVAEAGLRPVDVGASDFELFRARLGRRTVDEVCAYPWSADPAPYLDPFFIFGRAARSLGEQMAGT
jgi:uncharacterized protein (TIGR03083 family)